MKLLKDSKRALLKPHLLSVEELSIPEIDILLNKANFYADANKQRGKIEKTLKESTVITLFFEISFEEVFGRTIIIPPDNPLPT